jgi:uncharacterized phage protein (TIGR01671 family)
MRGIKFRAWIEAHGQRVYSNRFVAQFIQAHGQMVYSDRYLAEFFDNYSDSGAPIMQYTDLKDKNGTEIYEGDIVEHPIIPGRNIINWSGRLARMALWVPMSDDDRTLVEETHVELAQQIEGGYEVIGNIYENPELWASGEARA